MNIFVFFTYVYLMTSCRCLELFSKTLPIETKNKAKLIIKYINNQLYCIYFEWGICFCSCSQKFNINFPFLTFYKIAFWEELKIWFTFCSKHIYSIPCVKDKIIWAFNVVKNRQRFYDILTIPSFRPDTVCNFEVATLECLQIASV